MGLKVKVIRFFYCIGPLLSAGDEQLNSTIFACTMFKSIDVNRPTIFNECNNFCFSGLTSALCVRYNSKLKKHLSDIKRFIQPNTTLFVKYAKKSLFIETDYENISKSTQCDDIRVHIVRNTFRILEVLDHTSEYIQGSNRTHVECVTCLLYDFS